MDKFNPREFPINYFSDYGETPVNADENTKQYVKNVLGQNENHMSEVALLFFSDKNIEIINKELVLRVFESTGGNVKIPFQSKDDLLVIMRFIYISHAKNLKKDIKKQVYKLNCRVINEILPNLLSEVESNLNYLNEIEKNENEGREINQLPVSTKMTRGTLELPSMSDIFMK